MPRSSHNCPYPALSHKLNNFCPSSWLLNRDKDCNYLAMTNSWLYCVTTRPKCCRNFLVVFVQQSCSHQGPASRWKRSNYSHNYRTLCLHLLSKYISILGLHKQILCQSSPFNCFSWTRMGIVWLVLSGDPAQSILMMEYSRKLS